MLPSPFLSGCLNTQLQSLINNQGHKFKQFTMFFSQNSSFVYNTFNMNCWDLYILNFNVDKLTWRVKHIRSLKIWFPEDPCAGFMTTCFIMNNISNTTIMQPKRSDIIYSPNIIGSSKIKMSSLFLQTISLRWVMAFGFAKPLML